jgi:hypothetical protein
MFQHSKTLLGDLEVAFRKVQPASASWLFGTAGIWG